MGEVGEVVGGVLWCSEVWVGESTPQGPIAKVILIVC